MTLSLCTLAIDDHGQGSRSGLLELLHLRPHCPLEMVTVDRPFYVVRRPVGRALEPGPDHRCPVAADDPGAGAPGRSDYSAGADRVPAAWGSGTLAAS